MTHRPVKPSLVCLVARRKREDGQKRNQQTEPRKLNRKQVPISRSGARSGLRPTFRIREMRFDEPVIRQRTPRRPTRT